MIGIEDVHKATEAVYRVAQPTPLLHSASLSERFGGQIYLKAECLQHTGSFKPRGAAAKIASLTVAELKRGVITASAGNHAQGVAVAARAFGTLATVVMPEQATLAKIQATRGYGAQVILHGAGFSEAVAKAQELSKLGDAVFIPAYDDEKVIAGQGSVGLEIAADLAGAELVLVPVGGGGLISGVALALKALIPEVKVIGVQASAAPGVANSLRRGRVTKATPRPTLADGVAVPGPGLKTLPLIRRYVDEIVTVEEEDIGQAVVLLLERTRLVAEGAGALGVAALLSGKVEIQGRRTVVAVSGGNIDVNVLASVVQHGLLHEGRYLTMVIDLDDKPGALAALLSLIASKGANVLNVDHNRQGIHLPLRGVEVRLLLETRDAAHIDELTAAMVAAGYKLTHSSATARSFRPGGWLA
ncbi:MAG: threonine ammonia-lyase [Dehalococcoidia bacterium]|nr:threonine ammonia-lyase [Dehalococcoidia bacterium]